MKATRFVSVMLLACLLAVSSVMPVSAKSDYATTSVKAERFFRYGEWASAQALYELMLDERPDVDTTYVKAIVASAMLGDADRASRLLASAMSAGLGFDRLMSGVRTVAFEVGAPAVYEDFLFRSQRDCPWLVRAIDSALLDYYVLRNDGGKMVVYAGRMLAGLPDSVHYLSVLADGYALLGDFGQAVTVWKGILELAPRDYDTLLKLGNYMADTGQDADAVEYLGRAAAIRPTPFVDCRLARLDDKAEKR